MDGQESHKKHQRFQRKPLHPYRKHLEQSQNITHFHQLPTSIVSTSNKRPSSALKLQPNIVSITIKQNNTLFNEDLLSDSLFSVDGTPIRPRFKDVAIVSKHFQKQTQMKLEYSPDSFFQGVAQQSNLDESELLLDYSTGYLYPCKQEVSTTSCQTQIKDSRLSCAKNPICSRFTLYDTHCGLKVGLLTINNYIFRLEFQPAKSEAKKSFDGSKLVARMRKYFRLHPFQIGYLYNKVLTKYTPHVLRRFLLESSIKYSTSEVTQLETAILTSLQSSKPEETLELMVFAREEEDELILNLSEQCHCDKINLGQNSFWNIFYDFFQSNEYFRDQSSVSILQLSNFISGLV